MCFEPLNFIGMYSMLSKKRTNYLKSYWEREYFGHITSLFRNKRQELHAFCQSPDKLVGVQINFKIVLRCPLTTIFYSFLLYLFYFFRFLIIFEQLYIFFDNFVFNFLSFLFSET